MRRKDKWLSRKPNCEIKDSNIEANRKTIWKTNPRILLNNRNSNIYVIKPGRVILVLSKKQNAKQIKGISLGLINFKETSENNNVGENAGVVKDVGENADADVGEDVGEDADVGEDKFHLGRRVPNRRRFQRRTTMTMTTTLVLTFLHHKETSRIRSIRATVD